MIDHTTHWIRDFMQSFLQLLWDRLVQFLNKSVLGQTCRPMGQISLLLAQPVWY